MNPDVILAKIKAYPLALSLLGGAILMAVIAYFREDSLTEAVDQNTAMEQESKTIENNIIFGRDLDGNLKRLRDEQKNLASALIDPTNIIENQQYFYGFEHINGLHIIDPTQMHTDKDKADTMSTTTFTMQATGAWEALTTFLYELETGPHLVRVSKFDLSKYNQPGQDAPPNQMSATVEVQVLGK
jgi:hypothetical protein